MKGFCPLASGSKGNCIFVGTKETKILIDAGISCSLIEKKLQEIGVRIDEIEAVIITHEHSDHIKGLETLATKYRVPILANSETAVSIQAAFKKKLRFKIFTTGEPFTFGDIEIHPFSIPHDAADPVAFIMHAMGKKIGFCSDLGFVTSLVYKKLEMCDYLYIESNHQVSMVHACNRPDVYKQRVLSRQGHLSNEECAELIDRVYHRGLKHIHLAHLSSECNSADLALKIMQDRLLAQGKKVEISIAWQEEISKPIHFLEGNFEPIMSHSDMAVDAAVL